MVIAIGRVLGETTTDLRDAETTMEGIIDGERTTDIDLEMTDDLAATDGSMDLAATRMSRQSSIRVADL